MLKSKKIIAIKKIGKRKVYDISVSQNHNFFLSNNILSHNSETKGIVEGSQDLTFIGRISSTSKEDRAAMADALYSVGKITRKQIDALADLRPGEFILIEGNEDAKKRYIFLPRTLYWKEKYKTFNHVWGSLVNKWLDISTDKEFLINNYNTRKKIIVDNRKAKLLLENMPEKIEKFDVLDSEILLNTEEIADKIKEEKIEKNIDIPDIDNINEEQHIEFDFTEND